MKMDLDQLCKAFAKAKDTGKAIENGVNRYLLEEVLRPTLFGQVITLAEVDCDEFDEDDIERLAEYCDELYEQAIKLKQFITAVSGIQAIPSRCRQFC